MKQLRRDRVLIGEGTKGATLAEVAKQYLILKAEAGKQSDHWMLSVELYLHRACNFFGSARRLTTIGASDLHRWIAHPEMLPSRKLKGATQSPGTIRHHLNVLSSVYLRAQSLELVRRGFNPDASMMPGELPKGRRQAAAWLEVHEAA